MEASEVEALFQRTEVNRHLGMRWVSGAEGEAVLAFTPRDEFRQEAGYVQGGILSALGDTAAAYALIPTLGPEETVTGVEFKLNFLRSAKIEGPEVVATAHMLHRGQRLGLVDVEIAQGETQVARGLFTFMFLPRS
jgi:uncharacterized protein (TIGR00369 family)